MWTRDAHELYEVPRAIQAGRVWVNCYHDYPAGAPFGGYKSSGFGRENHKMMLSHYRQHKNMLISYSEKPLGFFVGRTIDLLKKRHAECSRSISTTQYRFGRDASAALSMTFLVTSKTFFYN